MSDWAEVGSPPGETFAPLTEGMLREAGTPTDERWGAGFGDPGSLSTVPEDVLVPEPALTEARRLPEDTMGLDSW